TTDDSSDSFDQAAFKLKSERPARSMLDTCVELKAPFVLDRSVHDGDILYASYAVEPKAWAGKEEREFLFSSSAILPGHRPIELFRFSLHPATHPEDRGWHSIEIPLTRFSGKSIQIHFESQNKKG